MSENKILWIGLAMFCAAFLVFGFLWAYEGAKRVELEAENTELKIDIVEMAEILDTLAARDGFSGRLTGLIKLRYGISVDSSKVTE